jgi:NADP-dependent 3-hydroxy acid dehydrogenase YdfG
MHQTVLITGASTGIGKETAKYFLENGWNVVATMRNPENEKDLKASKNLLIVKLDVTDKASIISAIEAGINQFKKIDVIVNNAGYGLMGAFEGMNSEQIKKQFETNVFGLMNVCHKILPHFRQNNAGKIINISSVGGRVTFPLFSIYHSTKWAVEGFSESLQYELEKFNIQVKCVEPGAIKTDFYHRSADRDISKTPDAYQDFVKKTLLKTDEAGAKGATPRKVAKVIFQAANDHSFRLRYPVGFDIKSLLFIRKFIGSRIFSKIVKFSLGI